MNREPTIIIEGVELTKAQAMAVRVAVGSMLLELESPPYHAALGPIADAYRRRLGEVQQIMFRV